MSKIVIPKHSADVDEMNAVLKIHYEANDWVKGPDFTKRLKELIGADQYPSSYPKKAQVPAYFGFLESKVSAGGRITERRITESGRGMYEAIINDNIATRQKLLMDALEKMIFGRNNAGCTSSDSDIEPPALLVKCVLDTGYCTSAEYAYLVWALNDYGYKYYESLDEIIKARSAGGIALNKDANEYKDWKPILAMIRWGFLIKSDDDALRVLLHPYVIDNYSDRLQKLMVYNIDKHEDIEEIDFDEVSISGDLGASFKPFKIDDANLSQINTGHFLQSSDDIEEQKLFEGDQVLLVDRQLTRLAAYYSYLIKGLTKKGENYDVNIQRQFAIDKSKEKELITALKAEDEIAKNARTQDAVKALINYEDYEVNLEIQGHKNKDILPAYLILKALLTLKYMTRKEQDYLVYSLVDGEETYTDTIEAITTARRRNADISTSDTRNYSDQPGVRLFKEKGIFEGYLKDGRQGIQINTAINSRYSDMLQRLSFYAVDIEKQLSHNDDQDIALPKVIKAINVSVADNIDRGIIVVADRQVMSKFLLQGDFVVFINMDNKEILGGFVYQITECKKTSGGYELSYRRRHVINPGRKEEIIKMIQQEV